MLSRRRSANVAPNRVSPQPAGDSASTRQRLSMVTDHTVETESPVDETSPQEIPLLPLRPAAPPQLPHGSGGLRRQSTQRNTNETYSSDSEERNPPQPPNVVPAPPPRSDPHPVPVSSEAAEGSPNLFRKIFKGFIDRRPGPLMIIGYFLVVIFVIVTVYSSGADRDADNKFTIDGNGVAILGDVSRFDWLDTHRLSVTWSIFGLGEYQPQSVDASPHWEPFVNRAVDVYLDDASKPAFSHDPAWLPVTSTGEKFGPLALISFNTEHWTIPENQNFIPLDRYHFTTFVFVIESATNKSVPITTFVVRDRYESAGPTTTSVELETRNNFTYNTEDGPVTVEVESRTVLATTRRSSAARALTFSMFAINWILVLGSVAIALMVFARRGEVKDGVAFLPITVILSIPTIRFLYVGSPPLGIFIDTIGFFPQMLIAVVCTMIVLYVLAIQSTRGRVS